LELKEIRELKELKTIVEGKSGTAGIGLNSPEGTTEDDGSI